MNPPTELQNAICSTCGEGEDTHTGLCLACLMHSAAESHLTQDFDLFADESELPRLGNCALIEEIGRGGMGVIYKARHLPTGRLVAIKKLQDRIAHDPKLLARFRREAQTAANLDHQNILQIHEVNDEADGVPFFTMKLALGGSLAERRDSLRGRFREVAALMAKVARAVHYAHESGVIHRDLKPGNILLDAHGEPLVSDFGLATWLHRPSDLTQTVMICGTPGYLPPEFLQGRPEVLNPASDLYSLGVILFELLTGRLPHPDETSHADFRHFAEKPAPRLRTYSPAAGHDLEVICARSLEIEPAMRYSSAAALADDLEFWLEGKPIRARLVPSWQRLWKWLLRHPALSLAGTCCFLLAATGLLVDGLRRATVVQLSAATAYGRSVAVLPVEDLDTVKTVSPLAREATKLVSEAMGTRAGLKLATFEAVSNLPLDSDRVHRLSRELKSRFLVSATIRTKQPVQRMVIHLYDALNDSHQIVVVEKEKLDSQYLADALRDSINQLLSPEQSLTINSKLPFPQLPSAPAEGFVKVGDQYREARTATGYDHAIQAYEHALKERPNDPTILARLADGMAERSFFGDRLHWLREASRTASRAMQIAPNDAPLHSMLATIAHHQGDFVQALEHAVIAAELEPQSAGNMAAVASELMALAKMDEALLWNGRAAEREASPGSSACQRGDCCMMIGRFDDARRAFLESSSLRPDLAQGFLGNACLALLQGDLPRGLRELRELAIQFPNDILVAQSLAAAELHFGDPAAAEALYRRLPAEERMGLNAYLGVRAASALGYLMLASDPLKAGILIEQALQQDEECLKASRGDGTFLVEKAANLVLLRKAPEAVPTLQATVGCCPWTYWQILLDVRFNSVRNEPWFSEILRAHETFLKIKPNHRIGTPP